MFAVLLVASERGKQWVACACEQAEAKGVRAGMSLAHAKALLAGMRVWERPFTPAEDARRLHRFARWAQRFSPVVAADEPDGLLLDMAGCERLFGGDEQMVNLVDAEMKALELQTRSALAPTVGCAWAAARHGSGETGSGEQVKSGERFPGPSGRTVSADQRITIIAPDRIREALAPLPIAGLRIDPAFVAALNEVGIERIGSLFDLPRQELACRFGPDLLRRLDQATGRVVETVHPHAIATPVEATRLFDEAVTSLEAIVTTVRELLFALVLQLEGRQCGVRTLDVVLERMSAEPFRLSISLTFPSHDVRHLWTLLRPKLERINLGYGVESVFLRASRVGRLLPRQLRLRDFGPESGDQGDEAALGEFLDRLTDRFGPRWVCRMTSVETHVPEEAFPLQAWCETKEGAVKGTKARRHEGTKETTAGAASVARPSQLFSVPEAAQVISLVPEGPPSWMRWRGRECAVRCASGPERLALPWWETKYGPPPSSEGVRDYYEVQDDQGRLLWMFRDRATHGWFVHGLWA